MKFDLIRPCTHCPFRTDETRITFRGRARAKEIEELAYRQGFVCHEHGEVNDDDEGGGIDFREDGSSQHCFGALFMYLRDGYANVPWEHACEEDETLEERWWDRLTLGQIIELRELIWESPEDFIAANE